MKSTTPPSSAQSPAPLSPPPRRRILRPALRAFTWLLLAAAAGALAADIVAATRSGKFRLAPLGKVWSEIHLDSLLLLQPAIERYVLKEIWQYIVQPVLETPATLVFAAIALLLLLATARWRGRARTAFNEDLPKDEPRS